MNQFLEELARNSGEHLPNAETSQRLQAITLVPVIGVAASGKSTCMDRIVAMDGDFGRVQSFTTRERRPEEAEDEYRFLPHTLPTLEDIVRQAREGTLVQYHVHHQTGMVYGSDIHDYNRPFMMLDTMAKAIPSVRRLPFKSFVELTLVAEPQVWERRFISRNFEKDDAAGRLREGIISLQWSLEQGSDMPWVDNTGNVAVAAQEIRGIAKQQREPNPANRKIGERLLSRLLQLADISPGSVAFAPVN